MSSLFGTDGVRGQVGTQHLTMGQINILGASIGHWLCETYGNNAQVLIAQDTRESGNWITAALSAGLLLSPVTIHYAGILPTPAVCALAAHHRFINCGIIISASHNHYRDNGIKIVNEMGSKISTQQEQIIETLYFAPQNISYTQFGKTAFFANAAEQYRSSILTMFSNLSLAGHTIILDTAHGATYQLAPAIFKQLGAHVITLHAKPNGTNINNNCGSQHVAALTKAVITHNADMGCAFDGDGDRVILINKQGKIKNGDDLLALLSQHPQYASQQKIIGTIMSNHGLDLYLQAQKKQLIRTAVGDRWVAQYLTDHNLLLGGEQSGHIILRDYLPTGDGIVTALRVLETVQKTNNWLLESFERCPQLLVNLPVTEKKDLKEPSIAAIITKYEKELHSGRLSVRYSGTEQLLRIMVEDQNYDTVKRVSTDLTQALKKQLQ